MCCPCCGNRSLTVPEGVLFGMGSPLLDITAVVDDDFLAKYKLEPDNAILLDGGQHHKGLVKMVYDLVDHYEVDYVAGGAAQNTLRVAQWILRKPKRTTYVGSVGVDKFSRRLEELMSSDGVNVFYQKWEEHRTGTCAALITGNNRSLCAHLSASKYLTMEFLAKHFSLIEKAAFYYIEGYFLAECSNLVGIVAKHADTKSKTFTMNISAPYIPKDFTEQFLLVLPYVDILFGNKREFVALAEVLNFDTEDIVEIGKKTLATRKHNASRSRVVVITQNDGPVIVVSKPRTPQDQELVVQQFPIIQIPPEKLKDTNGAGDAFVGGYLAQHVQGKDIEECVKCAIWAAAEVLQQVGCTFPKRKVYKSDES